MSDVKDIMGLEQAKTPTRLEDIIGPKKKKAKTEKKPKRPGKSSRILLITETDAFLLFVLLIERFLLQQQRV